MPIKTERVDVKEKQMIAALAASGKSQRAIGRATGRDNKTIARVLKEPGVMIDRAKMEERLADKFEQLSEAILDSVSEEDLFNATLQQKSISAGVMLDKSRVIRGQSNMNIAVVLASVVIEAGKQWKAPDKQKEDIEDNIGTL
jgi:lambda repressor-like predicted transcriptional regulator